MLYQALTSYSWSAGTAAQAVSSALSGGKIAAVQTAAYDPSGTYQDGDIVTYLSGYFEYDADAAGTSVQRLIPVTVEDLLGQRAALTDLADAYDSATTYDTGDVVTKDKTLYRLAVGGLTTNYVLLDVVDFASVFVPGAVLNFEQGDYTAYDGVLYVFGEDISALATGTAQAWLNFAVQEEFASVVSTSAYDPAVTYSDGDIVTYEGDYYQYDADAPANIRKVFTPVTVNELIVEIYDMIAPKFDESTAYASGDCVVFCGKLYRFTSAHTAGPWTINDVVQTTLFDEIGGA